jgi:HEAT repeat protein
LRELQAMEALGPALDLSQSSVAEISEHAAWTAVSLLRKFRGRQDEDVDVELMCRALADPHEDVACEAARVLGLRPDARAVRPLRETCIRGSVALASIAGKSLRSVASADDVDWLAKVLLYGDNLMACAAEAALVALGGRAIAPLLKVAKSPYNRARLGAVRALGEIRSNCAVRVLASVTHDLDRDVREAAVSALEKIRSNKGAT